MVCLYLDEPDPICVKTTCGINKKKGFDLSSEEINKWIIKNNFDKYEHRNPTKLGFEYHLNGSVHVLKYLYPLYK